MGPAEAPVNALAATTQPKPIFAESGTTTVVSKLAIIEIPTTCRPPKVSAKYPPGSDVKRYPQK